MCRSIKKLRRAEQPATDQEMHEAALQFVRKVSGYRVPSRANQDAFEQAIAEIAASTKTLLGKITTERTENAGVSKNISPRPQRPRR